MSSRNDHKPATQPQQHINGFYSDSSHLDLSILTSIFTDQPPPRPYTMHSSIMPTTTYLCRQPTCPLKLPHSPGVYRHMDQPPLFTTIRPHFGASNPPPEIWKARDRIIRSKGRETDFKDVVGFIRFHYVSWTEAERQAQEAAIKKGLAPNGAAESEEEDNDTEMDDLANETANVHIKIDTDNLQQLPLVKLPINQNVEAAYSGPETEPCPPTYSPRTEAEIDRQFEEAFLELELEEAVEAVAKIEIGDDIGNKENVDPRLIGRTDVDL